MQNSTAITSEIERIKGADQYAKEAVEYAKDNMSKAVEMCRDVGQRLDALKASVGSRKFAVLLAENFSEGFAHRAKAYRKIVKVDERQALLSLGVIPDREKSDQQIIKPDPFYGWVNKISGHVRQSRALAPAERVALKGLHKDIERALGI